jgi:hypothetical protein
MIDLRMFGNELNEFTKRDELGTKRYTVDEIYQFHVKCHDQNGMIECFNMGDLVTMGVLASGGQRYGNPYNKFD